MHFYRLICPKISAVRFRFHGFVLLVFLLSCKEERRPARGVAAPSAKNVRIQFMDVEKSRVPYGDTLWVTLEVDDPEEVVRINLHVTRGRVPMVQRDDYTFGIPTLEMGGGQHGLRAEAMLADSSLLRGSASVRVVLPEAPPEWSFRLIDTYPHDIKSYTQGLVYHEGVLFESAGQYGKSDVRKVALETGEVLLRKPLDAEFFAEGLALADGELFQLTWRERTVFVYDLATLNQQRRFGFDFGNGEGWGLAWTGEHFVFSDGSADLYLLRPEDWSVERQIRVFDHQGDVIRLNELEYVDGKIYANMLDDERIAVIDVESGAVQAYWNLAGILDKRKVQHRVDVMNGIAYRPDTRTFLITGKLWPSMFEVVPVL
ncbi:MAG: hypothetical protein EA392_12705 [Cryomorphaceae bacterium]|nr:MAG: hypothetical protein EA392_12705 [Cryomorphaceae bacterium]